VVGNQPTKSVGIVPWKTSPGTRLEGNGGGRAKRDCKGVLVQQWTPDKGDHRAGSTARSGR